MTLDPITRHVAEGLHERLKADPEAWKRLEYAGEMMGLELRNCSCGSTLAIEVKR